MLAKGQLSEPLPIESSSGQASHLAVCFDGEGASGAPCVLYMHGFASSQDGEKVGFFRQHFRDRGLAFCSFDFQGHGESGGSMRELSLSRNISDIRCVHRLLEARGHRRIVLFGSSMGGGSALWYAALHPAGVLATISIAPALDMGRTLTEGIGPRASAQWQREGRLELPHALGVVDLGWGLIEDLRSYPPARLATQYGQVAEGGPPAEAGPPALIFQGKKDTSVGWRAAVDFATGCDYEGVELHLIADGDHRLNDRLDHLWRLTASFLEAREIDGFA